MYLAFKPAAQPPSHILILFIKNITSFESLLFVRNELDRLSFHGVSVEISEIRTEKELNPSQYGTLRGVLHQAGVELFEDKKHILAQRIKNAILEVVYHCENQLDHNLSTHLTEELHHDYTYMSNLFSETQHITIEKFYICQQPRPSSQSIQESYRTDDLPIQTAIQKPVNFVTFSDNIANLPVVSSITFIEIIWEL